MEEEEDEVALILPSLMGMESSSIEWFTSHRNHIGETCCIHSSLSLSLSLSL